MSSAGEGGEAPTLHCPLCGTKELCDECLSICAGISGEMEAAEMEGAVTVFSKSLEQTLHRALTIARQRGDSHAIEADLVLALIDDPEAAAVVRGCNVDLDAERQRITAAEAPLAAGAEATPSATFQRIIQRAVIHVQQSAGEGGQVTGADVLVAVFAEPPGAELLQALGFTRYDAVSYLSPGTPGRDQDRTGVERPGPMPPGSRAEVRLLNDDYTPMEFVVDVIERMFAYDREAATRLMLEIHHAGFATCGVYPFEAAAAKVTEVLAFAREHQHPLHCFLVPLPA